MLEPGLPEGEGRAPFVGLRMPRAGGLEYDVEDWDNDQQCLSDDALQLAHFGYLLVSAGGTRPPLLSTVREATQERL